MLPEASLSHLTSGRFRVRIPSRKRDAAFFTSVQEQLPRCPGVRGLQVNALTGSVLVFHGTAAGVIGEYAAANGLFKLTENGAGSILEGPTPMSQRVIQGYEDFDRRLKSLTGGEMDVGGAAFIVLLGMGIYQISRGNFMAPAWYTTFWYAFNVFLKAQPSK